MLLRIFKSEKRLDDHELIARYKKSGEMRYVAELYKRYSQLIAALCYKYLQHPENAEDAAMDVFEIISQDLKTHDIRKVNNWLYSVTKHHCLKEKRRFQKENMVDFQDGSGFEAVLSTENDSGKEDKIAEEAKLIALESVLPLLKEDQKTCVECFYIKKMSYLEISESTGLTINKVKSHIQNGKRKLKIELDKRLEKQG